MLWECDLSSVSRFQFAWRWRWSIAGRFPERESLFFCTALSHLFFLYIYISSCLYAAEAGGRVDRADTYYLLLDVPITLSSSLWGGDQTLKGSQSSLEQKNTTAASLKITLSAQLPVAWWPPSIWELIQSSGKKYGNARVRDAAIRIIILSILFAHGRKENPRENFPTFLGSGSK